VSCFRGGHIKTFVEWLKGKTTATSSPGAAPSDPREAALQRTIEEQRKTDPLIGVKIGSQQVAQQLMNAFKSERGVHIESYLACLGALAGYACQASVRESGAGGQLVTAQGADGKTYFFGDVLNAPLAEDRLSVWSLIAGALQNLGKPLPDVTEIFRHVAATVGTAPFGVPRMQEGKSPSDLPINYLQATWPRMHAVAKRFSASPEQLPLVFAVAIQTVIIQAKDVIDPTIAAGIAMECAVAMSKVENPAR
jgi:hypothetical protein